MVSNMIVFWMSIESLTMADMTVNESKAKRETTWLLFALSSNIFKPAAPSPATHREDYINLGKYANGNCIGVCCE